MGQAKGFEILKFLKILKIFEKLRKTLISKRGLAEGRVVGPLP